MLTVMGVKELKQRNNQLHVLCDVYTISRRDLASLAAGLC